MHSYMCNSVQNDRLKTDVRSAISDIDPVDRQEYFEDTRLGYFQFSCDIA
jgi:hypothetical protein